MAAHKRIHYDAHADRLIRNAYQTENRVSGNVKQTAQKLGISSTSVHRRALYLGVVRGTKKKSVPWTQPEIEIVEQYAHCHLTWIIQKLVRAGYPKRTESSILYQQRILNIKKRQAKSDAGIYSVCELSRLSGIDKRSLVLYIQRGWLKAEQRGDVDQREFSIKAADVRRLLIDYTAHIDILRFDKFWLVDVLTNQIK